MKRFICLLLVLLLLVPAAMAQLPSGSFTHPEIGEFLTMNFADGMPFFSIYDFLYYQVQSPMQPYRGLTSGYRDDISQAVLDPAYVLTQVFSHPQEGEAMYYTGINARYAAGLNQLPLEQRVQAMLSLNGFEGAEGQQALLAYPGFEGLAEETSAGDFQQFQVQIGDMVYPYRLLSLMFKAGDHQQFHERYSFVKTQQGWRLLFITQEYTDDYMARGNYIHGTTGAMLADIQQKKQEAMLGTAFGMQQAEAQTAMAEALSNDNISLVDGALGEAVLFRLPAKAAFTFEKEGLSAIQYSFTGAEAYYSIFLSLYTRFSDPVSISQDGRMRWSLNDVVMELVYDQVTPTLSMWPVKEE